MAPKRKDRDSEGAQQKNRLQQQQHETFLNAYSSKAFFPLFFCWIFDRRFFCCIFFFIIYYLFIKI